jgi:hypothetical protein
MTKRVVWTAIKAPAPKGAPETNPGCLKAVAWFFLGMFAFAFMQVLGRRLEGSGYQRPRASDADLR